MKEAVRLSEITLDHRNPRIAFERGGDDPDSVMSRLERNGGIFPIIQDIMDGPISRDRDRPAGEKIQQRLRRYDDRKRLVEVHPLIPGEGRRQR